MAIAVSLWFDTALEARVRELWRELAAAGVGSSLFDGRYRPHITLGVCEIARLDELEAALHVWVAGKQPFGVQFQSVGLFPGGEGVVFLQPTATAALRTAQGEIFALVSSLGAQASPYFDPDRWVPHCTMAWGVPRDRVLKAADILLEKALPLEGTIAALGMIDTPAEVELRRFDFRS